MAKTSEELQAELEKEINQQIKVAEFHAGFKARFDVAKRLVEDGKLTPEEIADVTMVPVRFVNEMVEELSFSDFCREKFREGNPLEIKRTVAENTRCDNARKMIARGKLSLEEIAEYCELPLEKVQELAAEKVVSD